MIEVASVVTLNQKWLAVAAEILVATWAFLDAEDFPLAAPAIPFRLKAGP